MTRRRELLLSAFIALWGVAIALSLAPFWAKPAPPDQLPGYSKLTNLDAHAPMRFILGIVVLPIALSLVLRPIVRRLAAGDSQPWARNTLFLAAIYAMWAALATQSAMWTFVPAAIAIAIATAMRRADLRFTRHDFILVPVLLTTFIAFIDLRVDAMPRVIAFTIAVVIGIRIAITFIASPLAPAFAFLAAPLAVLMQTSLIARNVRYLGWPALLIIAITPFVLRFLLHDRRRALLILTFAVYPLAIYGYSDASSLGTAEGRGRIDFFEDAHSLMPASEYLRGDQPYRDVLPGHGFISDGFFDYVAMKMTDDTAGKALRIRKLAGQLTPVAIYALGAAATGVAEVGLLGILLAMMTGTTSAIYRVLPAMVTLAFTVAAIRRRKPRLLIWAGAASVITGLTSLDFAAYSFLALLVATLRFRGMRKVAIRSLLIGCVAVALPVFATFAAMGFFDDFVRGTFREILSISEAFTLSMYVVPPAFAARGAFPDLLGALFAGSDVLRYLIWFSSVIGLAVFITRAPRRRIEPLVILALWVALAGISYAERHHLYFEFVIGTMLVIGAWLLYRRRSALAPVAVVVLLLLAMPVQHLGVLAYVRGVRGPSEPAWIAIDHLPRARGSLIIAKDAKFVETVKGYLDTHLGPDDTFFDFTNRGVLFFLLDRDNPIRQSEVSFYEPDKRQWDVVRALERNPRVKAALVPSGPEDGSSVDHVPNRERAPIVWQWLERNFEPDFRQDNVVIWRRK